MRNDPNFAPGVALDRYIYGANIFERERFADVYNRHADDVRAYFRGADNFLEVNICGGEGWERLCPFLGKPTPDEPFPKTNVYRPDAPQAAPGDDENAKERAL